MSARPEPLTFWQALHLAVERQTGTVFGYFVIPADHWPDTGLPWFALWPGSRGTAWSVQVLDTVVYFAKVRR